jgi:hypothetical protein
MIVASLLLILVAVTLLVLGLTGGSSNLLISSIVASLLAAVALVVGARQNAGARRSAGVPGSGIPNSGVPGSATPEFAAEPASSGTDDFASPDAVFAAESVESDLSDRRETVQLDAIVDPRPDEVYGAEDEAFEAGRRDAAAGMTAGASGARRDDDLIAEPDYDRAAEAINAARSENPDENAWRRADAHAEAAAGLAEPDFDEPDEDDPADEPLPQSVSPTDAVRVARLDAEVLVVDGRPRYHVPDCPHLVGRLTEPIPVNEAVELGFSPCGLCRPVDRLVAAAVRR